MRKLAFGAVVGAVCLSFTVTGCDFGTSDGKSDGKADAKSAASAPASPGPSGGTPGTSAAGGAGSPLAAKLETAKTKTSATTSVHQSTVTTVDGVKKTTVETDVRIRPDQATHSVSTTMIKLLDETSTVTTETVGTAQAFYAKLQPEEAAKNGGKQWERKDLAAAAQTTPAGQGAQSPLDPTQHLALLQKSGDIREVGTETVNGVQATHYSGTVDLKQLRANNPQTKNESPEDAKLMDAVAKAWGDTPLKIELWIGADQLPVKQVTGQDITVADKKQHLETTVTFTKWNSPVNITTPPANQTIASADVKR
ncbi:LppX_LprAFG lipoprotein [Yinghuangia seranimata]|uniref:LppX_LprAFG lipoprotein n=1 Tax=Yinghuangia seranimata TaxID=408067 RepID=UPI00248D2F70|nr:LppX_LprAFG lipoprotein [Yinghuangia seranimata]MDI2130324.1 LppX_LprAFG lipoprotein [Yinghuangia seranimata]